MAAGGASPTIVEIPALVIDELLGRTKACLSADDQRLVEQLVESLVSLTALVRQRGTTIARLRRFIGMTSSERTANVLGQSGEQDAKGAALAPKTGTPEAPPAKAKGHGRVPCSDYPDAQHIPVGHQSLHAGEPCPCGRGTLYQLKEPARFLRIIGQAPLVARCWDCERLRCSACNEVFTARAPEEAQGPKYTETAASMMALLRYGAGMPLNRLGNLQRDLEAPVPASTQWGVAEERVALVRPAYDELCRLAAQGSVVHNDDTYVRILEYMGKRRAALLKRGELKDPDRTGLFTTAIVSKIEGDKPIALFFSGRKHAGENLADLLKQREAHRPAPIQMSDALDRNLPKGHTVVESNCLSHGRRHIVDEVENFPTECRFLLQALGKVFKVDERCRTEGLSPDERLLVHQRESGPVMKDLEKEMRALLDERRVEPNSDLGQALNYLLKRWEKFTLFLRVPGAPLENNRSNAARGITDVMPRSGLCRVEPCCSSCVGPASRAPGGVRLTAMFTYAA